MQPWMEEERELLPHQEAAILLEFARDGMVQRILLYVFDQLSVISILIILMIIAGQDLNGSKLTLRSRLCYRLRHKVRTLFVLFVCVFATRLAISLCVCS